MSEFLECLDEGLKESPDSYDLNYARLRLIQFQVGNRRPGWPLVEACERYFKTRCKQLPCFDELRAAAAHLSKDLQQRLIKFSQVEANSQLKSQDPSSIITLLNALKLEYCLRVSEAASPSLAQRFAGRVIEVYVNLSKTQDTPRTFTAQFAMLASMAVLKSGLAKDQDSEDERTAYLQSCFILHYSSLRPGVEYQTQVVLLRLFAFLGALSMSSTLFHSLSIKNLQFESIGYLLLTRISTLHSANHRSDTDVTSPAQAIDQAMSLNQKSFHTMQRRIMEGLEYKSYMNVLDAIKLRHDLELSYSEQLSRVEKDRLNRLNGSFESWGEGLSMGE